ncbi:MAG: sulfotransferase domain-containing protein [Bacteroidota bacterium]
MKLDFVIIGGQKCGSTYLNTVIDLHPEVAMILEECPHFESPDYENGGPEKLDTLLKSLPQDKLIGIKRPNYLALPEVAGRLLAVNKNMKLIVILRNPLERLKSAYFHLLNYGFCPVHPLNEGIEKLLNGELSASYPRTNELLQFGFYGKHLQPYKELFGDNLLVLTYDNLKKDKLGVIKTCYSFLGLDDTFVPWQKLDSRPQEVNYSLLRTRLLTKKNKHRFIYNENNTRLFAKNQSNWDKFVCRSIDYIDQHLVNRLTNGGRKPAFSKAIKQRLLAIYMSDIELLERSIGHDLSKWKSAD